MSRKALDLVLSRAYNGFMYTGEGTITLKGREWIARSEKYIQAGGRVMLDKDGAQAVYGADRKPRVFEVYP